MIDLSQGLDRELDQRASGIAGCLTPRGQHFISTRGGPLLGVEALALQGIPIDRLLLNNESQKDLHDLAGNAMSSPVVGAAILTALILGHKALLPGPPASNEPERQEAVSLPSSVTKPYPMQDIPVEISTLDSVPAKDLLVNAQRSCRLCLCEGQSGTRRKNVLKCSKCNHTACVKCGRNPSHVYEPIPAETLASRIAPIDFEALVKTGLPMRLQLMGLSHKDFEQFRGSWKSEHVNAAWKAYMDAVKDALDEELRFSDVSRQRAWAVTYEGAQSLLKLICSSTSMVWHLYVLPDKSEPSNSPLRQILAHPVARMTPSASLFSGTWQIGAPISSECSLTLSGSGNRVDSLGARVGLTDEDFRDRKVWSHLSVQGSDKEISHLDLDVRGKYELLQDCGGPLGSLHKKETSSGEQIYLFIDPTEFGPDQFDSWVFATEHDRLDIGQTREVIAQLQPNWNAFELGKEPKSVKCWYREWAKSPDVSLGVYLPSAAATYHILDRNALSKFCRFDCSEAYAPIFNCTVPATSDELTREPGVWERAELMESPVLLQKFAWLLQKAISVTQFSDWITVNPRKMASGLECALCAPPKPRLTWTRNEKDRVCAYEHPEDAAAYERSVKNRPAPFLGFVSRDENSNLQFRICLNMITLLHQALGNLPRLSLTPTLQWRLCIDATGFVRQRLPKLIESNNKNGAESSQPPGFKHFPLRPEQLRSLKWMREQESAKVLPFEEEEVVEALLPVINWRAEGRASSKRVVKGGILGDDVGYGKTAISLGLLDTQFENDSKSVPLIADGAIPVKATLIVVPHHLFDQWLREIRKFLVSKYRVLQIKTLLALKTLTIGEVEKVDIVLASASIFRGNNYYELMRLFAAAPEVPQGDGRIFDEWFRDAINGMKKHITLLRADGAQIDVPTSIRTKNERLREEADLSKYNPSKRLKGQKLQDHLAKKGKSSAKTTDEEPDADDRKSDNSQESKQNGTAGGTKTSKRKRLASDEEDYSGDYESDPVVKPKSRAARQPKKVKATKTVTVAADTKMAEATYHFQDAKHDWKRMRNPLVHMFDFTRVIIDEFTYSKERSYTAVLSVPARSKWILSGTPPLNDFADVKSFSPFLGINLGIDEDDVKRTDNERLKTIQRDRTGNGPLTCYFFHEHLN